MAVINRMLHSFGRVLQERPGKGRLWYALSYMCFCFVLAFLIFFENRDLLFAAMWALPGVSFIAAATGDYMYERSRILCVLLRLTSLVFAVVFVGWALIYIIS